jgi:hypothetical protein
MGFLFKLVIGGAVFALLSYLILEVLKLRNTVKSLRLQLSTTENFNSNMHSNKDIQAEIDEYKKELAELHNIDTMVQELEHDLKADNTDEDVDHSENSEDGEDENDENSIVLENEDIDYDHIETLLENDTDMETLATHIVANTSDDTHDTHDTQVVDTTVATTPDTTVATPEQLPENVNKNVTIKESDIQFFLDKYGKPTLKKLCSDHKLTKGGSKAELIKRLLTHNVLQNELPNDILDSLDIASAHTESLDSGGSNEDSEGLEGFVGSENVKDTDISVESSNATIHGITKEYIQETIQHDVPNDTLLYNLKAFTAAHTDTVNTADNQVVAGIQF